MHTALLLANLGATFVLLSAAMNDIVVRRVSNGHVLALLACGLVSALAEHRLGLSMLTALTIFGLTLAMWLPGFIGGADAKLLTASGLLLAPAAVPDMILCTVLAGGVLCLPYMPGPRLFRRPAPGRPSGLLFRAVRCEQWRLRRHGPLPYAVAIAAGAIFTLVNGS